ncbi:hypothetical protein V5F79_24295 [Xanthobacter flavus]|uniref:hypothetical protein n=1 Tax=Xanthobacter TaxID=279 RepID=UPI00372BEEAD
MHILMDCFKAIDREVGLPFGRFFLMTHGNWGDSDVGQAIAQGLKVQAGASVRLRCR